MKLQHFDQLTAGISALTAATASLLDREAPPGQEKMMTCLMDATLLLTQVHQDLTFRRRDLIRRQIPDDYKRLFAKDNPPSGEWLLGDKLEEKMKNLEETNKLGKKLKVRDKRFFPASTLRGHTYHPYRRGMGRGRGYPGWSLPRLAGYGKLGHQHGRNDSSQGAPSTNARPGNSGDNRDFRRGGAHK